MTATGAVVTRSGPVTSATSSKVAHKLGLFSMTLLVVGAMVGGGAFNLPQNMAQRAGLGAVLIAWLVSGLAILVGSSVFWIMNWLVLRGVKSASALNVFGTIAKFVPIIVFVGAVAGSMKAGLLTADFWGRVGDSFAGAAPLGSVLTQVKSTMLVILWVFIGIEGAVVMSDKSDTRTVSRATLLAFFVTLVLNVLISVLPFGVMSQAQLSGIAPPSTAAILGSIVGKWGEYFINVGVLISVLTGWLVWTMLVTELPWAAARDGTYPQVFAKTNAKGAANVSLWVSTAVMQLMMMLVYFSNNAWNVMLSITGVMVMPTYIGATGFLWQLIARGQYPASARIGKKTALLSSMLGTLYGFWLVYAAGLEYMIAGAVFFALGNIVFIRARREHAPGEPIFTQIELYVALTLVVLGAVANWMLFSGHLIRVYSPS